ncbi:MAG: hypothetical protein Q7R95_11260 [bacterium]|nr:hypothetical protein [bacterium]
MIYLSTLKTINGYEIKERYGKEFRKIKKIQPKDSISCNYVVFRGDISLQEFRRLKSAVKFCVNN